VSHSAASLEGLGTGSALLTRTSPCRPTPEQLGALHVPSPDRIDFKHHASVDWDFQFFLHDDGAFNFDEVAACLLESDSPLSVDDVDLKVMPNEAEHLTDLWLLKKLRDHPSRTMNLADASLHVVGAPLFASFVASSKGRCGLEADHAFRASGVAAALEALPAFQRCNGCDFLFINSSPAFRQIIGHELMRLLRQAPVLVATADRHYHAKRASFWPEPWRVLIIPYKAHFKTEEASARVDDARRSVTYMFHGNLGRRNSGSARPVLSSIAQDLPNFSLRNQDFKLFRTSAEFEATSLSTAKTYRRSSFCLVPAGDSPTSRRLYDALAAGCVPIVLAELSELSQDLPFPGAVDWPSVAIFAGPTECFANHTTDAIAWLKSLALPEKAAAVEHMRAMGRTVFKQALSYTNRGVATMLLREAKIALASPRVGSRGQYAQNGEV